ncbi:hypothetical protein [Streptomyces tateyamensis]|uniref:hypothetical protein n=1 Tax=Streptomyces tateyamensis TaxID=565073 RepID=UPI001C64D3E1|nr:hypothetical protein [Streptomyces tateyamensis]
MGDQHPAEHGAADQTEDVPAEFADPAAAREDKFRYGLEVVLDGLAGRLAG